MNGTPLGQVSRFLRGITFKPDQKVTPFTPGSIICMRTSNIQTDLDESSLIAVPADLVRSEDLYLRNGDILISSANSWNLVGKCAYVSGLAYRATAGGFIAILRADPHFVNPRYLYHWLNSEMIQAELRSFGRQTTNISNLDAGRLREMRFPLRSLEEQKRIAAILDKADDIRRKREQAIQLADEFVRSLFLNMFGDPVHNPKGWPTLRLGDCVTMESGSTPSKEISDYWGGDIPWVSPKDMKSSEIIDSADHITRLALDEQRAKLVPSGSVLIVIRGMILAHTVPVALNQVECCINQDMKALMPSVLINSVFLANTLRSLHGFLLSRVTTSTHGTKKLDSDVLRELIVPVPPLEFQKHFSATYSKIKESIRRGVIFRETAFLLKMSTSSNAFQVT